MNDPQAVKAKPNVCNQPPQFKSEEVPAGMRVVSSRLSVIMSIAVLSSLERFCFFFTWRRYDIFTRCVPLSVGMRLRALRDARGGSGLKQ